MRLISLGIFIANSAISIDALNALQKFFNFDIHYNFQFRQPVNTSAALFFWEKLVIDSKFHTSNIKIKLEEELQDTDVFINELGEIPTWWNQHKTLILGGGGIGIAVILGIIAILISK